jgi:HAE1 family hydrophobic/amphiphilic exporter-1
MKKKWFSFTVVLFTVCTGTVHAQQDQAKAGAPSVPASVYDRVGINRAQELTLSMQQAIRMALEKNRDIEVERLNVEQSEYDLFAAKGAYDPVLNSTVGYESRSIPVASLLAGGANGTATTRSLTYDFSARQQVSSGGNYNLLFSNSRLTNNNTFISLNPQFNSFLSLTFTQPLLRNFRMDQNRRQIRIAKGRLDISDAQFKQKVLDIIVNVQRAYWELVYALRNVQVQRDGVDWAKQQLEINKRMAAAGVLAPVEIVAAEAELEGRVENVLIAIEAVTRAENQLKGLILPDRASSLWSSAIAPTDANEATPGTLDLSEAVRMALASRPELEQLRLQKEVNAIDTTYYRNQTKPQVDVFGAYGLTSLSGSLRDQLNPLSSFNAILLDRINALSALSGFSPIAPVQTGGLPSSFLGGQGRALTNLFSNDFRDVRFGVSIGLPLRNRTAEANLGRSLVAGRSINVQRERVEQAVEIEVRNVLQAVRTAQQRVEAAAAARKASEQQLASETRQYEAGETTNFLVLTRQNALSAARARELRALVDYNKALADLQRSMGVTLNVYNVVVSPRSMQ